MDWQLTTKTTTISDPTKVSAIIQKIINSLSLSLFLSLSHKHTTHTHTHTHTLLNESQGEQQYHYNSFDVLQFNQITLVSDFTCTYTLDQSSS